MSKQFLADLPLRPYKKMAPFIKVYKPAVEAIEGLKPSKEKQEFSRERDHWNFKTSGFSKPLAEGRMSVNRAYNILGQEAWGQALQRQMLIRDFFGQLTVHGEEVFLYKWKQNPWNLPREAERSRLNAWKDGTTGYDIIDASMIQLRETGKINNRQRMATASYLAKVLRVDWRLGEEHFAKLLVDYHPASNLGNWLWVASAGFSTRSTDVLNPLIQQRRIDPEGTLVQKYLPRRGSAESNKPIVSYDEGKKEWLKLVT